jgi:hypothetical protein
VTKKMMMVMKTTMTRTKKRAIKPEDHFPCELRQRPTEDELDKDFEPNEEVQGFSPSFPILLTR